MPLLCVENSFSIRLPFLNINYEDPANDKRNKDDKQEHPVPYHSISNSSVSTALTAAIRAFATININFFVKIAFKKLKTVPYLDEFMSGIEMMYLLSNEADIVRASSKHLVYPVNMVLSAVFPNEVICNSEVTYMNQSRFDMRWAILHPGQEALTFAILEFKAAHVLHWFDFAMGACTYENQEA